MRTPSGCLAKDLMSGSPIERWTTTIAFALDSSTLATLLLKDGLRSSMGPISSHRTTCALASALSIILGTNSSIPLTLTRYFPTLGPCPDTSARTSRSPVEKSTSSNPLLAAPSLSSLE